MGGSGWGDYPTYYTHAYPVGRGADLTQGQIDDGWRDEGEAAGEEARDTDAPGAMAAALTILAVVFVFGVLCGVVLTLGLVGRV